jgi:hypothetical protein
MVLSTLEQGLLELLDSQLDGLVGEYEEIATNYNLPTDEEEILKMVILVAEKKLSDLSKIDEIKL